jgi:hypothetical protein
MISHKICHISRKWPVQRCSFPKRAQAERLTWINKRVAPQSFPAGNLAIITRRISFFYVTRLCRPNFYRDCATLSFAIIIICPRQTLDRYL